MLNGGETVPHDLHSRNRDSKFEIPSSTRDSFFKLFIPHCHVGVSRQFKKYLQFICISLFAVDMFNRQICFEPWFYKAKASIRSMVTMSCVAPIETWPRIVSPNYEPSSNETHENDIQENQHGDPGIRMGSNTPQPTIVWNSLAKQKIICIHL